MATTGGFWVAIRAYISPEVGILSLLFTKPVQHSTKKLFKIESSEDKARKMERDRIYLDVIPVRDNLMEKWEKDSNEKINEGTKEIKMKSEKDKDKNADIQALYPTV